jgi:hypothetical protein
MSDESTYPQPSRLWKQMSDSQKLRAAEAFWNDTEGIEQQVEAMTLLAQRMKARPRYIQGLPAEKKAQHLARYPQMPDLLAARLLVSYHLAYQRPMMAAFLDAIGLAHENGLITADPEAPVSAEKIAAGRAALEAAYPAEDVQLYFATLVAQDPETWAALGTHVNQHA